MTNIGDVIRQVESVVSDTEYPPTREQLKVVNKILKTVHAHNLAKTAHHQGSSFRTRILS
ncbi:MAG: hypothetical protein OS112_03335 [Methanoregula sp.]|nr:MAG: hypothetical protein OS112_03335 [Methanoregula sp.]